MNIGVDVGSTAIKVVFLEGDQMIWKKAVPTKPGQSEVVNQVVSEGLKECGRAQSDIKHLRSTGYGRKLISESSETIDELSANAAGIFYRTSGAARMVINIGGQDVKVIRLAEDGQILDFRMNDKCAAGTGRFFEIVSRILDTPLNEFHDACLAPGEAVSINSTCAVFAESEIVSLMAKGVDKNSIIKGLNNAVAQRIANLAGADDVDGDVYVDGGPAMNTGLVEALEDELLCDINVLDFPQFTVAYGAAFLDK